MSDEKLRELERRFKETGSAQDEAVWLYELLRTGEALDWHSYLRLMELDVVAASRHLKQRVATGDLTADQMALAAKLGHTPAGEADGFWWLLALVSAPLEVRGRPMVTAIRELKTLWQAGMLRSTPLEASADSAEAWIACPCNDHLLALADASAGNVAPGNTTYKPGLPVLESQSCFIASQLALLAARSLVQGDSVASEWMRWRSEADQFLGRVKATMLNEALEIVLGFA